MLTITGKAKLNKRCCCCRNLVPMTALYCVLSCDGHAESLKTMTLVKDRQK